MNVESVALLASTALAAVAAAIAAWSTRLLRLQVRYQLGESFEGRFNPLNERLLARLGGPADGIDPPEFRADVVELVVLYGQVFRAHELGLFPSDQWEGLRGSLNYWMRQPEIVAAWSSLRQQDDSCPDGFVQFLDRELNRSAPKAEALWKRGSPRLPYPRQPGAS